MIKLDYIYGNEANRAVFYCMPKILFVDDTFRMISTDGKVLYSLMLDRSGLSARNGWTDGNARVYIYFTLEDAMKFLRVGHTKAGELYKELENHGMIERKKTGTRKARPDLCQKLCDIRGNDGGEFFSNTDGRIRRNIRHGFRF